MSSSMANSQCSFDFEEIINKYSLSDVSQLLMYTMLICTAAKLLFIILFNECMLQYSVLANSPDVSPTVLNSLSAAKASVANVHSATFKNHARHDLRHSHVDYWE